MFRILEVGPDGRPRMSTDRADIAPPPPGSGIVRWIDLGRPVEAEQEKHHHDVADIRLLGERFGFHALALEDLVHFDQRSKAEEYADHLFIVTHGFGIPPADGEGRRDCTKLEPYEVHAFLGEGYLVTVHDTRVPSIDYVWKRAATEALPLRTADFFYHQVLDAMVDESYPILDEIAEELEELENSVLEAASRRDLERIFALKRVLVTMRRTLSPQRDVVAMLAKRGHTLISEKSALYFRDVYDHLARTVEGVDGSRDLLGNVLDAYLSSVANRTNEIMKRLGLMSAVFLPLTFITGFFGQNFHHMPFGDDRFLIAMVVSCIAVPVGMLIWFYKSRWL